MRRLRYLILAIPALCVLVWPLDMTAEEPKQEQDKKTEPVAPQTFPNVISSLVEKARPSVVVITIEGRDGEQHGMGTGFVISDDGLIATNLHVIGEARPITVQFADGSEHKVEVVHASDRALDLALLKIEAMDLPYLQLGDSSKLRQGQPVVALGNPVGLKHSVVTGVVSGVRDIEGREMIQLAIPLETGNSGGPLLDMQGKVHGLLTMKSAVTANLGFAVAVNHLKRLIDKPNPVPMTRWLTIGALDDREWTAMFGSNWRQRAGRILVDGIGDGFGGRSLCLYRGALPGEPYELAVAVKLADESGAAGLIFHTDDEHRHYGFYPSNGRLRLSRFDGPNVFTWNILREVSTPYYRAGEWNHLKVRVDGTSIKCFVNEQLVIESADRMYAKGAVGLAKFRDTRAEFKHFQTGRKIESTLPSAESLEQMRQKVNDLPGTPDVEPDQFASLLEDASASVVALEQRAQSLERQAVALRQIAQDVHTRSVALQLATSLNDQTQPVDLGRAALMISQLDNAEVDVSVYLKEIDQLADQIKQTFPADSTERDRFAAFNKFLFQQNGFHGGRTEYYHRANSYLDRVIDDREGLPITLSVLYMEIGRRLQLKIEGVGLPGHFVARYVPAEGESQLIDVFDGGRVLSRDEAAAHVERIAGIALDEKHLAAVDAKGIVLRMLRNLFGIAERDQDQEAMLRYLEAMILVDSSLLSERGMRAVLRFQTGRCRAALVDLDWILETQPEGLDLSEIREMRRRFAAQMEANGD